VAASALAGYITSPNEFAERALDFGVVQPMTSIEPTSVDASDEHHVIRGIVGFCCCLLFVD
jgi:hypothetical protein